MEPNWEQLGRELEQARGSLKAAAVARAVGLSGTQLRNYERGLAKSGRPSAERLVALATLYGVDAQPWLDLVGYTVPARAGGSLSLVGGIGQARPHQRGADRGEELVASERDEIAAALVRIGQELVALGQRVADGPPGER